MHCWLITARTYLYEQEDRQFFNAGFYYG